LFNEHPERHQFAAHLMVAQYRSGRPAEALQTYRQVKGRLREDLGLDPPAQLRELETAILLDEPHLAAPPTADAGETRPAGPAEVVGPVPAQLPPDRCDFVDRTAELDRILALFADGRLPEGTVLTSIYGPPGVGKSALATRAAHRLAAHFPDGQLYIKLHGHSPDTPPVDPAEALERLLWALRGDGRAVPAHMEDRSALYRSELKHRRVLILLDDVASEAQVKPLLPGVSESRVLLTSRRPLAEIHGACPVQLDVLGIDAAVTLFARAAGRRDIVEREPELCRRSSTCVSAFPWRSSWRPRACGTVPFGRWRISPSVSGTRNGGWPNSTSASEACRARCRCRTAGSATIIGKRFNVWPPIPPARSTRPRRPGSSIGPRPVAEQLLEELVDVNLLTAPAADRYRMRELVRLYAAGLATDADLRDRNDFAAALQRRRLTISGNEPSS
jgi:hypothetical protein